LIAAMLLPVASAMATTSITVIVSPGQFNVDGVAHKTVTIGYTSDVDVRAFALDINVDNGMNIGDSNVANFLRGESPDVNGRKGYGIFPGRFRDFINPSQPDWDTDNNYMPVTPWNSPGAENTGLGYPKMVVELGTLYSGDPNKPALSGTLFSFDVNGEGLTLGNDCNLNIVVNALRGGIVGSDAAAITVTNLPYTTKVTFAPPGCTVPTLVGLDRAVAIAACGTNGFANWKSWSVPGTGQPMRQVVAQLQTAGSVMPCDTIIDFNDVNWPVKPTTLANSLGVNWVNRNRPACWAYPRQCRGGADGKKQSSAFWVGSNNLSILKSGFNKTEATFTGGAALNIGGGTISLICASADHKKQSSAFWVGSNNLNILKSFFNKTETNIPICESVVNRPVTSDANYNYWCLPVSTPVTACPSGQFCAPAGVCPNTP